MDQREGSSFLRLVLLLGGDVLACGAAAFLALVLAAFASGGQGPGATGDRMMVALGLLGLVLLAALPVVFLLARRWTGRTGLAALLAGLAGLGNGLIWLGTAFLMAVVLNR
ncbi:MAG: hypothetical protein IPL96_07055 [Holophagaceae bacterium]|nr:hypothetical protein [Holophagaceae bacterium]